MALELVEPQEPPDPQHSRLAAARLRRGLTRQDAADRAGLSDEQAEWLEDGRLYRFPTGDDAVLATMLYASAASSDRKSTRLNSSHTVIYTLSLHDALPISLRRAGRVARGRPPLPLPDRRRRRARDDALRERGVVRSEEHTSELQSHSDLHSFPTRRSSDLSPTSRPSGSRTAASTASRPATTPCSRRCSTRARRR